MFTNEQEEHHFTKQRGFNIGKKKEPGFEEKIIRIMKLLFEIGFDFRFRDNLHQNIM